MWAFETSKSKPSDSPPPTRPHLILPKQFISWVLSMQRQAHGGVLFQSTTALKVEPVECNDMERYYELDMRSLYHWTFYHVSLFAEWPEYTPHRNWVPGHPGEVKSSNPRISRQRLWNSMKLSLRKLSFLSAGGPSQATICVNKVFLKHWPPHSLRSGLGPNPCYLGCQVWDGVGLEIQNVGSLPF